MASPPSTKPASTSPSAQESPFSRYMSSLSPINPANSENPLHADLGVPSPQPVFTSPHINLPRKGNPFRRPQKAALFDAEKFFPGLANSVSTFPRSTDNCGSPVSQARLIPCSQKGCSNEGACQDQSSSSTSNCVDEFLADPLETLDEHLDTPDKCLLQDAGVPPCTQGDNTCYNEAKKESGREDLLQTQPSSKLVLAHKVMADSCSDPHVNRAIDLQQASDSNLKIVNEAPAELCPSNVKEGERTYDSVDMAPSYQTKEDLLTEDSSIHISPTRAEDNSRIAKEVLETSEISYDKQMERVKKVESDLPLGTDSSPCNIMDCGRENHDPSSICCHQMQDINLHLKQIGQWEDCNFTPWQPDPHQNIQEDDDHQDVFGENCHKSTDDKILDQEEVVQHQRAMRKRLQYESAENDNRCSGYRCKSSSNFASNMHSADSPGTPIDFGGITHADSVATPRNEQLTQLENLSGDSMYKVLLSSYRTPNAHICASDNSTRAKESSSLVHPAPSGIGLHLNSIGSVMSRNLNVKVQSQEALETFRGKSISATRYPVSKDPKNFIALRSVTGCPSVKILSGSDKPGSYFAEGNNEVRLQENQELKPSNASDVEQNALNVKPLNCCPQLNPTEHYMIPCNMKELLSEDACGPKEPTNTSPKKKRKKVTENDGCKRCSCKRSKCLKLYCDCFAAGTFCSEDCACQECSNRAENKDLVHEARQRIESRNPLAFAPKVVQCVTETYKDIDNPDHTTPSSARHKRGCNCKKSQCLKKYCECYQAGVGCSLGCRCEGCKNTFGTKDELHEITDFECKILRKEMKYKLMDGGWESDLSCERLGMDIKSGLLVAKQHVSHLSPLTPFPQGSDLNDASRSYRPISYCQSPEPGSSALRSHADSPSSPMDSTSNNSSAKATEESLSIVPCDQELESNTAVNTNMFSPRWDGFPEMWNLSPLVEPSPCVGGSSASKEHKGLQTKLFQGGGHLSAGLRWRRSPVTPPPQFGEGKCVVEPDSDRGLHYNIEDDTPDILKETNSPVKALTASSPNKKRVSPPAQYLHETRSSISPAIKSGRKYILKSVPSFPPLTPYCNNQRHGT